MNNIPVFKLSRYLLKEIAMSRNKFCEMAQIINYCITAKLDKGFLGRNVRVVQQLSNPLTVHERITMQLLKRIHVILVDKTASVGFINVENQYTVVRGYGINGQKPKHKNVTFLKERMDITVIVKGKHRENVKKPVFHNIQIVTKRLLQGVFRGIL